MRTEGVSIVIPNWNHELVLPRSLHSALEAVGHLAEHGVPAEVIVVDDASRDGSPVLLRQLEALYHDRGLRVLAFARNLGPSAARTAGLQRARHTYAVLLDADNELVPENMHHFYRSIRATGAAVVFGSILIHEGGQVEMCSHESFVPRMFRQNHVDTCAMYDIQQMLDVEAFSPDHSGHAEDWEMHLHLAAVGRRLVHVPMAFGRYYSNDLSRNKDVEQGAPESVLRRLRRIYHQYPEARDRSHLNTLHLRHHPDLGYL